MSRGTCSCLFWMKIKRRITSRTTQEIIRVNMNNQCCQRETNLEELPTQGPSTPRQRCKHPELTELTFKYIVAFLYRLRVPTNCRKYWQMQLFPKAKIFFFISQSNFTIKMYFNGTHTHK